MKFFKHLFRDEAGATAIEYGLIVAMIAAAVVAAIGLFSEKESALFTRIAEVVRDRLSGVDFTS